jgi:hypothetical protein
MKDVPGNFLEEKGASVIKSLVGRDKLTGEIKGSMETVFKGAVRRGHHMQQPPPSALGGRHRSLAPALNSASL